MNPIEPDFWKGRGHYSRTAIRDNSLICRAPVEKVPAPLPEEAQRGEVAADGKGD